MYDFFSFCDFEGVFQQKCGAIITEIFENLSDLNRCNHDVSKNKDR